MRVWGTRTARCALWLSLLLGGAALAGSTADPLREGFAHPPSEAAPRVWWHWMNGNISVPGLQADLTWMHHIGIGGVQVFEGDLNTPVLVPERLVYMSEPWQRALRAADGLARQLGMEFTIATSPGWSATGGPWVQAADAMKKLVWSEQPVRAGEHFHARLPAPPDEAGPYQDVPKGEIQPGAPAGPRLYVDSVVVAFPMALPAQGKLPRPAAVSASAASPDYELLTDGGYAASLTLPAGVGTGDAWIEYGYREPQTVRSVTVGLPGARGFGTAAPPLARLEASEDGQHFHSVVQLPASASPVRSASFAPVTARTFRLYLYADNTPTFAAARSHAPGAAVPAFGRPLSHYEVSEFQLYAITRVNAAEQKAGFATAPDYYALATPPAWPAGVVPPARVIDLSARLQADGTLDWTAPAGSDWVILRLGYSLTGQRNGPAPPEATGLEVDKLDARRVDRYLDTYLGRYDAAFGAPGARPPHLQALLSDSIEAGPQNWTDDLLGQFRRLRGYDPTPWLPALTGTIVGSSAQTDQFLWDFRRTIAQRVAQAYYGRIEAAAHARALRYYAEALEDHRPQLGDDLEMRSHADIPMGAMWTYPAGGRPAATYIADLQGAASVAHVYGKRLVGAESMTAFGWPWAFAPRDLKPIADLEMALGVNHFSIHESTHQPFTSDHQPGLSLNTLLGQYFNRNETWAQQAGAWIGYLARSSFLLQQGTYQADVAYFYGEEAPLTSLFGDQAEQAVPQGYAFDFVGADALLHQLVLRDHALLARGGTRYRVLYLGGSSRYLTLPVLQRLLALVRAGLTVVGDRPAGSPSLADDPRTFGRVVDTLWGDGPLTRAPRRLGEGWVYSGYTLAQALHSMALAPDWQWSPSASGAPPLRVLHRTLVHGELYFVVNPSPQALAGELSLRSSGRQPQLWRADSGAISSGTYRTEAGRTVLALDLAPHDALFILLRAAAADVPARRLGAAAPGVLATLSGPWLLQFQAGRGAPAAQTLPTLQSWTQSSDPGVRYFSGTVQYHTRFTVSALQAGQARIWLDLGEVRDIVTVSLNGEPLATLWHPPYCLEISRQLTAGAQRLDLSVSNLWVNRLIGDAQPGARHYTFTTGPTYQADAPLRPSGLLGPVRLLSGEWRCPY